MGCAGWVIGPLIVCAILGGVPGLIGYYAERNSNDQRTQLALHAGYQQGQDALRQEILAAADRMAVSDQDGDASAAGWLQSWGASPRRGR